MTTASSQLHISYLAILCTCFFAVRIHFVNDEHTQRIQRCM